MTAPVDTMTDTPVETATPSLDQVLGEQLVAVHSVPDSPAPDPGPSAAPADPEGSGEVSVLDGVPGSVDEREQARVVWRESVSAGAPLTGLELGERFGRSERWGRARIAETRNGTDGTGTPGAARTPARARRAGRRTPDVGAAHRSPPGTPSPGTPNGGVAGTVARAVTEDHSPDVPADPATAAPTVPGAPVPAVPLPVAWVPLPGGARLVAWAGFLFGTVISVAANVLHAWLPALAHEAPEPGLAPQIGAAVWPIALVISVEVLSRVPWQPGWAWQLARYGGAGVVAAGAAVISYGHLSGVLAAWGYGRTGAAVGPLVIDGLMTISGFALLAISGHNGKAARP